MSAICGLPLHTLSSEHLTNVYFLVGRHSGTADDFRSYLPRVLELFLFDDGHCIPANELTDALRENGASVWPESEKAALREYFRALPAGGRHGKASAVALGLLAPANETGV